MFEILFQQGQMKRAARAVILFISQGAYAGRSPVAPGTAGTIVGIFLYAVMKNLAPGTYFALCILISLLGTWAAGRAESILGTKDSASIVIDEIAGFSSGHVHGPDIAGDLSPQVFFSSESFDIVKPWPLRRLQDLHGGLGVMLDDIGAGVYTNILLQLAAHSYRPMNQLTEETFEQTLRSFITSEQIDLRDVSFIDPYGMLGLLEIGELCMLEDVKKDRHCFRSPARYASILNGWIFSPMRSVIFPSISPRAKLPITKVAVRNQTCCSRSRPSNDRTTSTLIVGKVRDRAQAILATHLRYDDRAINSFIVALSEVCQNIIEHSENKGFVGIQKYRFQSLNKNIVKIAVMDVGIGFRKSLSSTVQTSR